MTTSIYSRLPTDTFTIRLLRLSPSADASAPVRCTTVNYPIGGDSFKNRLYEALSYAWGSPDKSQCIYVNRDKQVLEVPTTQNLHAALIRLRNPYFERVLWVDALSINQEDDEEKAHQVKAMAMIYGRAWRVIVWLGEESNDSTLAFQTLVAMASEDKTPNLKPVPSNGSDGAGTISREILDIIKDLGDRPLNVMLAWAKESIIEKCSQSMKSHSGGQEEQAILALLDRSYFRRIWILQELAAARELLVVCGSAEMDGTRFRKGLMALNLEHYDEQPALQRRIRAVMALLEYSSAHVRRKGHSNISIRPMVELVEMFYSQEATDRRDKVYALMGMCSDHDQLANLEPDYAIAWSALFERLGRYIFGTPDYVLAHGESEQLLVSCRGFGLGWISNVYDLGFWNDTQVIRIESYRPDSCLPDSDFGWNVFCKVRKSAKEIREHDAVLLLDQSRRLIIARRKDLYLEVLAILDSQSVEFLDERKQWSAWFPQLATVCKRSVSLSMVWNWAVEEDHEAENVLQLMKLRLATVINLPNEDDSRISALCDMATYELHHYKFQDALDILSDAKAALKKNESIRKDCVVETRVQAQYAEAKLCASRYREALSLVPAWYASKIDKNPLRKGDETVWHCFNVLFKLVGWKPPLFSTTRYTGAIAEWVKYAAIILSHGIDAGTLCKAGRSSHPEDLLLLLSTVKPNELVWADLVLAAAKNKNFGAPDLFMIMRNTPGRICNLPEIIQAVSSHNSGLDGWDSPGHSDVFRDKVSVTASAIEAALEYCKISTKILSLLLKAAGDELYISQRALSLAAANTDRVYTSVALKQGYPAVESMALLLDHAGPTFLISERVMITVAGNDVHGASFLTLFLERDLQVPAITSKILLSAIKAYSSEVQAMRHPLRRMEAHMRPQIGPRLSILPHLKFFRNLNVSDDELNPEALINETSADLAKHLDPEVGSIVRTTIDEVVLTLKTKNSLEQRHVVDIVTSGEQAYLDMLVLCRERRSEFSMTLDVLNAALDSFIGSYAIRSAVKPRRKGRGHEVQQSWAPFLNYRFQRFAYRDNHMALLTLLVKNVRDADLEKIFHHTQTAHFAALNGYVIVLETIRDRLPTKEVMMEPFILVARLAAQILSAQPETGTASIINELAVYSNDDKTRELCNYILMLAVEFNNLVVVDSLLKYPTADVNWMDFVGRTPLHIATRSGPENLNTLPSLLQHGGGSSLDSKDNDGNTPRKYVNEMVRTEDSGISWRELLKDIPNNARFGTISSPDRTLIALELPSTQQELIDQEPRKLGVRNLHLLRWRK